MARPKRLNVDSLQGFNCSYGLKVAMIRAAEIDRKESPSSLIRAVMEDFCQRRLSAAEWRELEDSKQPEYRHRQLKKFMAKLGLSDLKEHLAAQLSAKGEKEVRRERLALELQILASRLEQERDNPDNDISTRVALCEAADLLQQLRGICRRDQTEAGKLRFRLLIGRFPPFWSSVADLLG